MAYCPLAAGTQLGHYRILSPLGAGGMGEVDPAEDTRLERKVALKVLPAPYTQDAGRVRRFMQEAKTCRPSTIQHHHHLRDRRSEAGRFIVMNLERGGHYAPCSARLLARDARSLGAQIAKALAGSCRRHHPPRHQARECHGA